MTPERNRGSCGNITANGSHRLCKEEIWWQSNQKLATLGVSAARLSCQFSRCSSGSSMATTANGAPPVPEGQVINFGGSGTCCARRRLRDVKRRKCGGKEIAEEQRSLQGREAPVIGLHSSNTRGIVGTYTGLPSFHNGMANTRHEDKS